jgi:transposase
MRARRGAAAGHALRNLFSIPEAAAELGVSPNTIRNWIGSGRLIEHEGGPTKMRLVTGASIEACKRSPPPLRGRPATRRAAAPALATS